MTGVILLFGVNTLFDFYEMNNAQWAIIFCVSR